MVPVREATRVGLCFPHLEHEGGPEGKETSESGPEGKERSEGGTGGHVKLVPEEHLEVVLEETSGVVLEERSEDGAKAKKTSKGPGGNI